MGDGEHDVLRTPEQRVECLGDPNRRFDPALPSSRALRVGRVRPRPRAVVGERPALERAEPDLAERRQDEPLDCAVPEREPQRLLRPQERRRDAEVDRLGRERGAERERLAGPLRGEAFPWRDGADVVAEVGSRVAVADEQQPSQNSTLR